jgi:hypothetical protein
MHDEVWHVPHNLTFKNGASDVSQVNGICVGGVSDDTMMGDY